MALDVKVKIDLLKPTGKLSYSYPLIITVEGETAEDKPYTEFKTLDDVATKYAATTNAYKAAQRILSQNNAPEKFAIKNCEKAEDVVTTIENCLKEGWRQLIVVAEGETSCLDATTVKAVSDYVETTEKMYFCQVETTTAIGTLTKTNERTVVLYYNKDDVVCPEASLVGATSGLTAGSFTYKNIILKSVDPIEITDTELETLHEAGGITIVEKAGDIVTSEGIVIGGEYADIIDSKDFVISNIQYKIQKVFNNADKVPYDNSGIAMLEAAVIEVMREAYNNGIIATNDDGSPAYTVAFALRSATTEADRVARNYPYGTFSFVLAGAIHNCEIKGEISI